jgi:hypothetical protein
VADHAGQAVATDEIAVTGAYLAKGQIKLDLSAAVQRPDDQRSVRVVLGLLGSDPPLVQQRLDERVVVGELG